MPGAFGIGPEVWGVLLAAAFTRTFLTRPPVVERIMHGLRVHLEVPERNVFSAVRAATQKLIAGVKAIGSGMATSADEVRRTLAGEANAVCTVAYSKFRMARFNWDAVEMRDAAGRMAFALVFAVATFILVGLGEAFQPTTTGTGSRGVQGDVVMLVCTALALLGPLQVIRRQGLLHSATAGALFAGLATFAMALACLLAPAAGDVFDMPVKRALADCVLHGVTPTQAEALASGEAFTLPAPPAAPAAPTLDGDGDADGLLSSSAAPVEPLLHYMTSPALPVPHARHVSGAAIGLSAVIAVVVALLSGPAARVARLFVEARQHGVAPPPVDGSSTTAAAAGWSLVGRAASHALIAGPLLVAGLFSPYLLSRPSFVEIVDGATTGIATGNAEDVFDTLAGAGATGGALFTLTATQWLVARMVIVGALCALQLAGVRRLLQAHFDAAGRKQAHFISQAATSAVAIVGAQPDRSTDAVAQQRVGNDQVTFYASRAAAFECKAAADTAVAESGIVTLELLATPVVTALLALLTVRRGGIPLGFASLVQAVATAFGRGGAGASGSDGGLDASAGAAAGKPSPLQSALEDVFGADTLASPGLRAFQPDNARAILLFVLALASAMVFLVTAVMVVFYSSFWPVFMRGSNTHATSSRPNVILRQVLGLPEPAGAAAATPAQAPAAPAAAAAAGAPAAGGAAAAADGGSKKKR